MITEGIQLTSYHSKGKVTNRQETQKILSEGTSHMSAEEKEKKIEVERNSTVPSAGTS